MEQVHGALVMNDLARIVLIFGVDNSSSSHLDNHKKHFLLLVERPIDDINDSVLILAKKRHNS